MKACHFSFLGAHQLKINFPPLLPETLFSAESALSWIEELQIYIWTKSQQETFWKNSETYYPLLTFIILFLIPFFFYFSMFWNFIWPFPLFLCQHPANYLLLLATFPSTRLIHGYWILIFSSNSSTQKV